MGVGRAQGPPARTWRGRDRANRTSARWPRPAPHRSRRWYAARTMALYVSNPLPQTPRPSGTMIRKPDEPRQGGRPTRYLTSAPPNCQGHRKQGKCERPSQPRDATAEWHAATLEQRHRGDLNYAWTLSAGPLTA